MPKKSVKYEVEMTGYMRYFSVNGEKGNEYTAVEIHDTNPEWTGWMIYNKEGEEVKDELLREEIIEAVKSR